MSDWKIWALVVLLTFTHYGVYWLSKSAVYNRLQSDQVTILKGGEVVDLQVYQADDDRLCQLLGGCLREPKTD